MIQLQLADLTAFKGPFIEGRLPREIAPGVFWLSECMVWRPREDGHLEHTYNSTYVIAGESRTMMVDTGHLKDWVVLRDQMDKLLAEKRLPAPSWIFPTHPEVTHSGNLANWLDHFPGSKACGDLRDLHLVFPDYVDRFVYQGIGDRIDLGGREFVFVDAVLLDLPATLWGYDTKGRVLFTSDGMGYGHYHDVEHCGHYAEELPDMPIPELTSLFAEYALYWTRFKNLQPHVDKLKRLMEVDCPTTVMAPAHGSVITDVPASMPRIYEGLVHVARTK